MRNQQKVAPIVFKRSDVQVPIIENNEPLISVRNYQSPYIIDAPMYHAWNIPHALPSNYLRESVLMRLHQAGSDLPTGYRFVVWDGYRPYLVQEAIYQKVFKRIQQEYPKGNVKLWKQKTEKFVSYPTPPRAFEKNPAPHITGGAVDITIADEFGRWLDFGTGFDEFTNKAKTDFYEKSESVRTLSKEEIQIRDNRRLLYMILTSHGFTNYHEEWWHYDFGNPWWSYLSGEPHAIYGAVKLRV